MTDLPITPDSWSVSQLGRHGIVLTCDELQIRLSRDNVEKFFDLIVDEEVGKVQTDDGFWIEVDADAEDGDLIITPMFKDTDKRVNPYPNGVVLDTKTLEDFGVSIEEIETDEVTEGVKMAYKKSGKKIKRGFRVTSGIRKGRVVSNIKTAHKPKAKASTRSKMRLARRKKKIVRILKSRRTKKKSISKRLKRMNSARK